jgi:hypothetical protein
MDLRGFGESDWSPAPAGGKRVTETVGNQPDAFPSIEGAMKYFGKNVIQAQNPDIPAARIYRGTLGFLAADFVLVALLIAFPALALWLPAALRI